MPHNALIANGSPLLGIFVFIAILVINGIVAAAKNAQKAPTKIAPPRSPQAPQRATTRAGLPSITQMPMPSIESQMAARRARMSSMDSPRVMRQVAKETLEGALAQARREADRAAKAKAAAVAARKAKPTKRLAAAPPPPLAAALVAANSRSQSSLTSNNLPSSKRSIASTEIRSASDSATTATTGVTARSLNAWLRPAKLRQQFILTEVFQPPVALRD